MPPYERHIFICTNRRAPDDPRGDCGSKGGDLVQKKFKEELAKRGLKGSVRANAAGCLDTCKFGVSVVVYPEGVWYRGVTLADVPVIVEEHIVNGRPVQRLFLAATPRPGDDPPP